MKKHKPANANGFSLAELVFTIGALVGTMVGMLAAGSRGVDPSSAEREMAARTVIRSLPDLAHSQCRLGAPPRMEARQKAIDDLSAYASHASMEAASMENTLERAERDCLMEKAQAVSWDF